MLSVTPAGFFAILLMLAWIIAVSLMLFMRTTPAEGPVPPPRLVLARQPDLLALVQPVMTA